MSLLELLDENQTVSEFQRSIRPNYATSGEIFSTSLDEARLNSNSNSKRLARTRAYDEYFNSPVFSYDADRESTLSEDEQNLRREFRDLKPSGVLSSLNTDKKVKVDEVLKKLKAIDPEKYKGFDIDKRAIQLSKDSKIKAQEKREGASSGLTGVAASFAGNFAASAFDPIEIAAMAVPIAKARTVLKAAGIAALENTAIETLKQPAVMEWQRKMGEEYGMADIAQNIVTAAVFGGVVGGGGKLISNSIFKKAMDSPASSEPSSKPDIDYELNNGKSKQGEILENKPSEILHELSLSTKDKDIADSLRDISSHLNDLENKPSYVTKEQHTRNIAQVNKDYYDGRFPDSRNTYDTSNSLKKADQSSDLISLKKEIDLDKVKLEDASEVFGKPIENLTARQIIERVDNEISNNKTVENFDRDIEEIDNILQDDPDSIVTFENKEMSVYELRQKLEDRNNEIKALETCKVV